MPRFNSSSDSSVRQAPNFSAEEVRQAKEQLSDWHWSVKDEWLEMLEAFAELLEADLVIENQKIKQSAELMRDSFINKPDYIIESFKFYWEIQDGKDG